MTVLAPAMLFLGLSVAVPLLLHLLQRHQGPRMVFPALRYLQRAEREHASRIRLRQLLLLALRVLALLLLAAAAARPFLHAGGGDHEPTSVVMILDNSMSTAAVVGERRVLDELKDVALATLESAGPDDRFWLIRAGESWEPALTGPPAVIARAVAETAPTAAAADLGAEVDRARSILAGEGSGRAVEVQLLSDLQASNIQRARANSAPVVALLPASEPPPNRGVRSVEVGGGLPPRSGERSTVVAEVGGSGSDSVGMRLVLDGSVRAAAHVPAGAAAVLPFPARAPGVVTGRVEIDADALTADDRRHFVARVAPAPAVAVTRSLPFLEEALDVLADAGRIRRAATAAADVVVAPGAVGVDAIRSGRSVVVLPPATPLELAAANQRLSSAGIPWRFGQPRGGEGRVEPPSDELGQVLRDARLREVYGLEPQGASDSTLLRLRSGEPWAVAGGTDARYVILGTPLTTEASSIPTSEAMLPLLDRALNAWASNTSERAEHQPGDVVTLPAGDSLVAPDGTRPVEAGIQRLTSPGVYRVVEGGEVVAAYAVNPPSLESDLERLDASSLADALGDPDIHLASAGEWTDTIFTARLGVEISWPLLLLALLLLGLELAISAAGTRRPRAGAGTRVGATAGEAA